ncbi:MAG: prepilin-type N-terminal cleavage/methylation domain-containing protein [Nitrospiraceae bacterium]|nr:MAG: prepilin-type N-terminal cleavage/methylation domain-containing protein [Nitrospiraceae bacterium]
MYCKESGVRSQESGSENSIILKTEFSIRNSRMAGFTLLEIMIALAIIGMTLMTVLHTVNFHSNIILENASATRMMQMAKEKMFEMETVPVDSTGNFEGTDITYENTVAATDDPEIIELKTVVRGQGREIMLTELVRGAEAGVQKAQR